MNPLLIAQLLSGVLGAVATTAAKNDQSSGPNAPTTNTSIDPSTLIALAAAMRPQQVVHQIPMAPASAGVIGVVVALGFFATLAAIVLLALVDKAAAQQAFHVLCVAVGIEGAALLAVVFYWYGSSWGSRSKDAVIAGGGGGETVVPLPVQPPEPAPIEPALDPAPVPNPDKPTATGRPVLTIRGRCSYFGGPDDPEGKITPDLAFWNQTQAAKRPDLFTSVGSGLFTRLNPKSYYIACRWNYKQTPASHLRAIKVKVTNPKSGKSVEATPVDWGPHEKTGRVADLSPGIMSALALKTDDEVIVDVPLPAGAVAPPVNAPGGPPWLARAVALRGLYEHTGSADNPQILEMARICGGNIAKTYKHDSIAWCALFVNYCLIASGYDGNDSLWALDFANYGRRLSGPAVGAIASKKRDGGGHVFIVRGRDDQGRIVGIGGNQSDMVCDDEFDAEAIVAFTWPDDAPLPPAGKSMTDLSTLPLVSSVPSARRDVQLPPVAPQ